MTVISTRLELTEWLKAQGLWKEGLEIPDVVPVRASKWVEASFEPDWIFDEVYVEVPRGEIREEIGGYVKVILDLSQHNNTVRVKFMRTSHRNYYSAISKLGRLDLPKDKVQECGTKQELLSLINANYEYKVSETDER